MNCSKVNLTIRLPLFFSSLLFILTLGWLNGSADIFQGEPYITHYTPDQFGSNPQNWSAAQDNQGIMYFGNSDGILIYDGSSWSLAPIPNASLVRSVIINRQGIVYVGAMSEFGFLTTNSQGKSVYQSLIPLIPENQRDFNDIWTIHETSHGMYFISNTKVFRLVDQHIEIFQSERNYFKGYLINDRIFIRCVNGDVVIFHQGQRTIIDRFREIFLEKTCGGCVFLPYADSEILIVTQNEGIFRFDFSRFLSGQPPAENNSDKDDLVRIAEKNSYLAENRITQGIVYDQENYLLPTSYGGIVQLNRQAQITGILDKKKGLLDNSVNSIFQSRDGNIWLMMSLGIDYIEANTPLTKFSSQSGINGALFAVKEYQGDVYFGGTDGLYCYLNPNKKEQTKSEIIHFKQKTDQQIGSIWDFLINDQTLLIASNIGIWQYTQNTPMYFENQLKISMCMRFGVSPLFSDVIFIGAWYGLWVLKKEDNPHTPSGFSLQNLGKISGINEPVYEVVPTDNRELWLAVRSRGVCRVYFPGNDPMIHQLEWYGAEDKIPFRDLNNVHYFNQKILISSEKGLHRAIRQQDGSKQYRFEPDNTFTLSGNNKNTGINSIYFDQNQGVWAYTSQGFGQFIKDKEGIYHFNNTPFKKVKGFIMDFCRDETGNIWLAPDSGEGLICFDSRITKNYQQDYSVLIRKITVKNIGEIFPGNEMTNTSIPESLLLQPSTSQISYKSRLSAKNFPTIMIPVIHYKNNSLTFMYSSTYYEQNQLNRFSCFLENFDHNWQIWTKETQKEYTNLPEGNFRFLVKAVNIYNTQSQAQGFEFIITPPWHRTYWAYGSYLIFLFLLFYAGNRLHHRRLISIKKKLEALVELRTAEIIRRKNDIEIQRDQLELAKNALWGDMTLARKIQTVLLPKQPQIPGYDIAVYMNPADEVGGDYYDVIEVKGEWLVDGGQWLDSERAEEIDGEPCRGGSCARPKDSGQPQRADLCSNDSVENKESAYAITPNNSRTPTEDPGQPQGFAPTGSFQKSTLYHLSSNLYPSHWLTIGDVSGHGVPAGLVMMMVQTAIRTALDGHSHDSPEKILQKVNRILHENIQKLGEDKYMTITLMSVQPNGTIFYSGLHQDILIFRAKTKDIEVIETKGMWIGMTADLQGMLTVDQITLHPGDTMLLYTDGITEAVDAEGTMFSEEKLAHIFKALGSLNPDQIKENLLHNLQPYSCADDITFLILKKC
jgi:serine phosphatase RsbU (regulator of sigma subunit)/ligand-binding sensor domain-containing protein